MQVHLDRTELVVTWGEVEARTWPAHMRRAFVQYAIERMRAEIAAETETPNKIRITAAESLPANSNTVRWYMQCALDLYKATGRVPHG